MVMLALGLVSAVLTLVQTALGAVGPRPIERVPGETLDAMTEFEEGRLFERVCWAGALVCNVGWTVVLIDAGMHAGIWNPAVGLVVMALAAVALQFVLFEVLLRSLSLNRPQVILRWLERPARALSSPMRPILRGMVRRSIGSANSAQARYRHVRDREMRLLPHVRGVDRVVEEEAVEMIDSVREFTEGTARDVMTPRTDVEGLPRQADRETVFKALRETPYSRLVVYEGNLDHIVGVMLVKEVLLNEPQDPFAYLRMPLMVPTTMRLPELLRELRQAPCFLAIVIDEYGGTAGIVTLHDLFEQVIGAHIEDEEEEDELWIEMTDADHGVLSGRVEIWEVNQELDLDMDEGLARTLGGYLMYRFARLPEVGEEWTVDGGVFTVRQVDGNRIEEVAFTRRSDAREDITAPEESTR